MEGPTTEADAQPSSGSISQSVSQVKDESSSHEKCDPTIEAKPESSSSTREVKAEQEESESKEENTASVKQEERTPEPDSEDSFTPERVVEVVQRLLNARDSRSCAYAQPEEREAVPPQSAPRERMLFQKLQEAKNMVLMLHREQEEQEDVACRIHSSLAVLSS